MQEHKNHCPPLRPKPPLLQKIREFIQCLGSVYQRLSQLRVVDRIVGQHYGQLEQITISAKLPIPY